MKRMACEFNEFFFVVTTILASCVIASGLDMHGDVFHPLAETKWMPRKVLLSFL